ncbi:MAG: multidrug efflux SMR transporter, partial [Bdellovibrionales bacterium]|nr:multidrug efflux SMR transporter [Bdellovibrionales bacterium]
LRNLSLPINLLKRQIHRYMTGMKLASYFYLFAAICFEILGTLFLQSSQQFTKPFATASMLLCYIGSVYFLSLALKLIPVGIAYSVWSGLGITLITLSSGFFFKQKFDLPALLGISLICLGVIIISGFSETY